MNEKDKKTERKPNHLLTLVLSVYLLYIGGRLAYQTLISKEITDHPVLFTIFGVIFLAVGVVFTVRSVIQLMQQRTDKMAETARQYAEETGYNEETDTYEPREAIPAETAEDAPAEEPEEKQEEE